MRIPENEIKYNRYSIADPFGRVFYWKNQVFRGIDTDALEMYNELKNIGLLNELVEERLIPNTYLTDYKSDKYDFILAHELVHPITFVYEWSFNMIKAAGKCILIINSIALKYGYETKDAHPYNILFRGCEPVFVDIGSIRKKVGELPWCASEEFASYYRYSLEIWNNVSHTMARRMYADDIHVLTSYEYRKMYRNSTEKKVIDFILARLFNRIKKNVVKYNRSKELLKYQHQLENTERRKINTLWQDYHDHYVSQAKFLVTDRFEYIIRKIEQLGIKTITELAGNWGIFSYFILQRTSVESIICTDFDENAINKMFDFFSKSEFSDKLSPVLLDFIKPVELINAGKPSKRLKSEAVLALAITHHLILTNNYRLEIILEKISEYAEKYVFIEFMPLGLWDGKTASPFPSWYNEEWFSENFRNYFDIVDLEKIEENRILYIGKKRA